MQRARKPRETLPLFAEQMPTPLSEAVLEEVRALLVLMLLQVTAAATSEEDPTGEREAPSVPSRT
jgi:hypothetical protein